jgi:hypothetical protein
MVPVWLESNATVAEKASQPTSSGARIIGVCIAHPLQLPDKRTFRNMWRATPLWNVKLTVICAILESSSKRCSGAAASVEDRTILPTR